MKVLFVISTLRMGGAERVCALIASKFSRFHEVTLAKFDESEPFYELDGRVRVLNLGYGADEAGIIGNIKKRLGKIFALRNLIKNGEFKKTPSGRVAGFKEASSERFAGFDAVISFLDSTNLLVLMSSVGLKTPIIISEHTSVDMPKARIFEVLKRLLYPHAQALSVLTRVDAAHYEKFCKNVRVIYNPNFSPNDVNDGVQKQNLVLFVGRLTAIKNCKMFVQMAANLNGRGVKFAVAGDGDEREMLENLARKLGADIDFLGNIADVSALYAKAKVLVSTSIVEGLGNTLIEAIGYDCARVATKTGGACELIKDGFNGLICEQNDDKTMSEMVLNLVQDDDKRVQICKNARLQADEFCVENVYKKWVELLKIAGVK